MPTNYAKLQHTNNPKYHNNLTENAYLTVKVEPVDGPTVRAETLSEWMMGQTFKVLYSELPLKRNALITEQELLTLFPDHNIEVEFHTISQSEWQEMYGVQTSFVPMAHKIAELKEKWNG